MLSSSEGTTDIHSLTIYGSAVLIHISWCLHTCDYGIGKGTAQVAVWQRRAVW